jgi:hypothetical protein
MKNLYFVLLLLLTANFAQSLKSKVKSQDQLCYEDLYGDSIVYGDGSAYLDEQCEDEGYDIEYTDDVSECDEIEYVPVIIHKECDDPINPKPVREPEDVHNEIIIHAKEEQEVRKEITEHSLKEEEKHEERIEEIKESSEMTKEEKKEEPKAEAERHHEVVEEIKAEVQEQIKEERKEERQEASHLSDLMKKSKKNKKNHKAKNVNKKEKLDE